MQELPTDYFRKYKNIILQGSQCDGGNPNSVIYPEVATYPSLDDVSVTIPLSIIHHHMFVNIMNLMNLI